jgi:uncharacterized integral membrane protein
LPQAAVGRWVGLIAAIAVSGLLCLVIDNQHWWIHALKGFLLLCATGIFWYVSWWH